MFFMYVMYPYITIIGYKRSLILFTALSHSVPRGNLVYNLDLACTLII
jgi:hypothetical protein